MSFVGAHRAYRTDARTHKSKFAATLSKVIDKSIYVIGLSSVAVNIPQLWSIWVTKNTSGVSLISWTGFFIGSVFWFIYGWLHDAKPVMLVNGLLIFIQAGIILGLLVYNTPT
jgi:uncharacterized protein with PQ loop repeat